jgi:hypothetical protein
LSAKVGGSGLATVARREDDQSERNSDERQRNSGRGKGEGHR